MSSSNTEYPRWQIEAKKWLISSLRTESHNAEPTVWNIGSLIERAGDSQNFQKSKRTWERFLANLNFLARTTETSEIFDDHGVKATLVINQLIAQARRSRTAGYPLVP